MLAGVLTKEKKMKKRTLFIVAFTLTLAGCAHLGFECPQCAIEGFDPRVVRQPLPLFPNVFVTEGRLVVDQEPIRVGPREVRGGLVTITWALAAGSPDAFAANGIVIGPGSHSEQYKPKCYAPEGSKGKVFACSFRPPAKGQVKYKYTINVLLDGKVLSSLDPNIEGAY